MAPGRSTGHDTFSDCDALPECDADGLADSMCVADCDRDSYAHADSHSDSHGYSYGYSYANPDANSHAICHLRGRNRDTRTVSDAERSFLKRTGLSRPAVLACTVGGPVTAN